MLDRLCVSRHRKLDPDKPLDLGALGEAMLFYGEVRLFADSGVMTQLIRDLTPNELFTALDEGYLRITYVNGGYGVKTDNTGTPFEQHEPLSYRVGGMSFDAVVDKAFAEQTGGESKARKLRRKLSPFVDSYSDESIIAAARQDLLTEDYVTRAARSIVGAAAPDLADLDDRSFEVRDRGQYLTVETDFDFALVNQSFHKRVPIEVATITPAFVLAELVEGRVQLQRSASTNADLATDAMTKKLLELKCEDLIARSTESLDKLDLFQDRLLEGRAVREAINQGVRSFSDLLKVIGEAKRFRTWVDSEDDDRDLLDAYYEEVTKRSWIDRLPTKAIRWAVFGGAGVSMTALGVPAVAAGIGTLSLGAFDELLLDRLGRGWRPDQFVEAKLARFMKDS